jgi:hypothetical protein
MFAKEKLTAIREFPSCFNNSHSIERIVYAVLSHLNYKRRNNPLKEFTQKD